MTLIERIKSAPPGRQAILAGAVLLVLCSLMIAGYFLFLRQDYAVLFRDLRTADAATIVAELDRAKTPYRLGDGGTTILVPEDIVDSTRLSVMSRDLPLKGAVGFELFNKSDMGLTEFAQRINYQRALQGELARTIMTIDGVDTARVHLTITEPTVFRADRRPPKASVTLVPRAGRQLSLETVRGVQRLVAASVPDLDVANVVVLDGGGQVVSAVEPVVEAPVTPEAEQKRALEHYYAAKVKAAAAPLYPDGGLEVTVVADLIPGAAAGLPVQPPEGALAGQARPFRLRVAVSAPPPVDGARQEELRVLAAEAIGQNASGQADVITVLAADTTWAADPAPTAAPAVPVEAAAPAAAVDASPRGFWVSVLLAVLLGLGGLAFWLHRRRGGATLSANERKAYAERLRTLLNDGEAHAPPV